MNIVDKARNAVTTAIRKGKLPRLTGSLVRCVDCGRLAECYDHRDYAKPLEVEPVCRKCNSKRGKAKNWVKSPLINIRLADDEKALIYKAAQRTDLSTSSWIRCALLREARKALGQV